MNSVKKNISLCASGELGLVIFLYLLNHKYNIVSVFTNKKSTEIIEFAMQNHIPVFEGNPRDGKGYDFIIENRIEIDILFSVNYLYIIDAKMLNLPWSYAINFHGSLLPKYRGRTPHVWAIINEEKEVGVTAHIISKNCDEGDIVMQQKIILNRGDTGAKILNRYKEVYPNMISVIYNQIVNNQIVLIPQNHSKATYFGKRNPEDGIINWNWFKERLFSWIQALSFPYPGAFTYYKGEKVVIDKIVIVDHGFSYETPNGCIITGGKTPIVKLSNGTVQIIKHRSNIIFEKDIILG
jgi:methionyl-tRNA formyltransferase